MAVALPVNMEVPIGVTWKDKQGNPCPVDKVKVEVSDPNLIEILDETPVLDADNNVSALGFAAVPTGPVGQVQVIITADPRLADDEEAEPITTIVDLSLLAGEASSGVAAVGALAPNRNLQA